MNFKNVSKDYLESGQKYDKDDAFNSANSTITNSFNQTQISVDSSDTVELIKNLSKKKRTKLCFRSLKKRSIVNDNKKIVISNHNFI